MKAVIPDGVKMIGRYAFRNMECEGMEEIIVPDTVDIIKWGTFSMCRNLKRIEMPRTMRSLEGIETLESATFSSCKSLAEIVLPESLKKIDYAAIEDCPALERINIPDGLEVIDEKVFDYLVDKGLIEKSRMKGLRTLCDEED